MQSSRSCFPRAVVSELFLWMKNFESYFTIKLVSRLFAFLDLWMDTCFLSFLLISLCWLFWYCPQSAVHIELWLRSTNLLTIMSGNPLSVIGMMIVFCYYISFIFLFIFYFKLIILMLSIFQYENTSLIWMNIVSLQGVPRNMTVDEYLKMSSSIIW